MEHRPRRHAPACRGSGAWDPLRNPQMPSLATVSFGGGVLHSDVSGPCVLMPESPAWELNSRT